MSNENNIIIYQGDVTVSVVRGDKIIRKRLFKNNGRWPLFQHLVEALRGNYAKAEDNRPIILGLYSIPFADTDEGKTPIIYDGEIVPTENLIATYATKDNLRIGSPGMFMEQPETKVVATNIGKANIKYTFLIPFSVLSVKQLSGDSGWAGEGFEYNLEPINLVCLYSKTNYWTKPTDQESDTYGNPSAFFFVEDNGYLSSLIPNDITALSNEYSLKVEWTLSLENKSS